MQGYWRDPELTAATVRDGWLHTGDIGRLDADGFLHIVDRKKDLIIRGGFNVYPRDVEDALLEHPGVAGGRRGRPPGRRARRGGRGLRGRRTRTGRAPTRSSPSAASVSAATSTRARSTSSTRCR